MDKRVYKTKRKIQDALTDLLQQVPLSQITVSMLCRKAKIDRNTFYSHYCNTAEAVDEIMREYEQMAFDALKKENSHGNFLDQMKTICREMYRHKQLSCLITIDPVGSKYLYSITEKCNRHIVQDMMIHSSFTQKERIEFAVRYTTGGSTIILSDWCRSGMQKDPDQIAIEIAHASEVFFNTYLS